MKSKITYNPYLSIRENAINNHVSESAIRRYIKVNAIDRKRDNEIIKKRRISELKRQNPNISLNDIRRETGYSINTIRKYLLFDLMKEDNDKLSTLDTSKQKWIIKSYSFNQDEILTNILRLYVKRKTFDCDLTYSVGNFYNCIPTPEYKFDKFPVKEDVIPLDRINEVINHDSLQSVIVDLPFIIKSDNAAINSKVCKRFNYFHTLNELYETNEYMLNLSYQLLERGGYLIIKTMDITYGKQVWVSDFVVNKAIEIGFQLEDKFILLANTRMIKTIYDYQTHSRKFHSYFFVFKK